MAKPTPILDARVAADIAGELAALAPAYVPELGPAPGGVGSALIQILGRFGQNILERLNQAPDKNKLAFFDQMGISLLPPQAARAPVVFQPIPNVGDGSVPAQTRVGAPGPDPNNPLVFQTEQAIALAAATLAQVRVVDPDSDSYGDYSAAASAGKAFTLFHSLSPIGHHIYLAHDTLLWLAGKSTVSIKFDLKTDGAASLDIQWEFWNGDIWQQFDTLDGTNGLTHSGTVHLATDCGEAEMKEINGVTAYWVRGITQSPLPPGPGVTIAAASQIRLKSTISRPLPSGCSRGLTADTVISGGNKLDTTQPFYPLGRTPDGGSALYFTNKEIFSKPGAHVALCYDHKLTPEEQADNLAQEQLTAQALGLECQVAQDTAQFAIAVATAVLMCVNAAGDPALALNAEIGILTSLVSGATTVAGMELLQPQINAVVTQIQALSEGSTVPFPSGAVNQFSGAFDELVLMIQAASSLASPIALEYAGEVLAIGKSAALELLFIGSASNAGSDQINALQAALDAVQQMSDLASLVQPANDLASSIVSTLSGSSLLDFSVFEGFVVGLIEMAAPLILHAISLAKDPGAGTIDKDLPTLAPASLIWEYWDGQQWATLIAPSTNEIHNFEKSGTVHFTVPSHFVESTVAGTTARWVRVRLASGSYNTLRFVTWKDQVTNSVTSMPLIQPRPPMLAGFYMGYDYISPVDPAEHCFTWNDWQWDDRTSAAHWGGSPFEMLFPMADRTPSLYFGFDKPLPAGVVSLLLNVKLKRPVTEGPALAWQYWDGGQWQNLNAQDDTHGLAVPGIVSVAWPGAASVPLTRFGTPYTWIRGALKDDVAAPAARMLGVFPNAVWADNLQTVQNETFGSSNGTPGQSFFLKQTPVLGDATVQVRELDGSRAATELSAFTASLLAAGLSSSDIRTVQDVKTGIVTEVWVTWTLRPNLLLSPGGARDFTIERDTGRIVFGDNQQGMIPPPGQDNILALQYTFGGGAVGNVPAGAITQLMSGVTAQGVTNPIAAEGGADGESLSGVLWRGPRVMRHRYRAISCEDYEDLAREASPGVASARALPARQPNGRPAPGWVTIILVPRSSDPQPQPSFELCTLVESYLAERAPASVAGLGVIGPTYLPVGVDVAFAPTGIEAAAPAMAGIAAALAAFLQPLTGGPGGTGWPFGRGVYLSDLAGIVESVSGVDYVSSLQLLLDGMPAGDYVAVPNDQIVAAGPINIKLLAAED